MYEDTGGNREVTMLGIFQAWMMQSHMPVKYKAHDALCSFMPFYTATQQQGK